MEEGFCTLSKSDRDFIGAFGAGSSYVLALRPPELEILIECILFGGQQILHDLRPGKLLQLPQITRHSRLQSILGVSELALHLLDILLFENETHCSP